MNLLPPEDVLRRVPKLGGAEKEKDPMVWVKFFNPAGSGTWLVTEFDGKDTFFGLAHIFESELGYFSLTELQSVRGPLGLGIERDLYFQPKPLSKARAENNM